MALTIDIEGTGVIAYCDAIADTAGGTWFELGAGTIALSTDVFKIRTASIGGKYASKSGIQAIDKGATTYDFTAGGAQEGELVYIWISMTALGTLDTKANYGLAIRLSSGSSTTATTNYIDFVIAGNDDKNGWDGAWRCFVVDPTKTPTRSNGTVATILAAVRSIGVWIDCSTSARADSIFINEIAIGSGLRITGTSTTGWGDVVDYCTAYATRGWGMFQERENEVFSYGITNIGDAASQTAAVSFTDSGRSIRFGTSEYWTGSAWASSMPTTASGINIEDHTTYTTTFSDGVVVGTDSGRSGSAFKGNSLLDVTMDLYGGNNAASVTTLYGTKLQELTGALVSGNDSDHKAFSMTVAKSGQYAPVGGQVIRNAIFEETTATTAALLWNANADVVDSKFIANTTGAAIEFDTVGTYSQNGNTFSGNTYDVLNSDNAATITAGSFVVTRGYKILTVGTTDFTLIGSADNVIGTKFVATGIGTGTGTATEVLVINKTNGANPSTANNTGTNSDTLFVGSVTLTVTVLDDSTGLGINLAHVQLYLASDYSTEVLSGATNTSGIITGSYSGATPADVTGWARQMDVSGTDYHPKDIGGEITASGLSITVRLEPIV